MVLYLLGIPLAFAAAKMLKDDIKYTAMDLRIDKASSDVNIQYKQIEKNFVDILRYSGAKCNIKKKGHNNYEIKNVQKGQYGGMERYLGEKGFYPQAINHAKNLFDSIADKENRLKNQKRDERINIFEKKLLTEKTNDAVITIQFTKFSCNKPQFLVEEDVEKLIDYFHTHNNENVFCNIIMENDNFLHHKEVWHIKEPISENAKKYYEDVYDKIIINNYSVATTDDLYELNRKQREINLNRQGFKICPNCDSLLRKKTKKCPKCGYNFKKGNFNSSQHNNDKRIEDINTESNNIDKDSVYYYKLGLKYKNSFNDSEKENAIKYFKKAIDLDPNFSKASKQLGYTLEELGRYEEAIEYLERVDSDDHFVSQHISNCYNKLREPREINQSKHYNKDNNNLSTKKEGDNNSHSCTTDDLYELNRKQREINLSKHYEKYRNYKIPTKKPQNEIKSNNIDKDSVYYYKLGLKYKNSFNDSEKENAIKYFKKAIDLDPNFSKALEQLGYTLEELGRYGEAIEYLERVDSDDVVVSQHITKCYIKMGESTIPYTPNQEENIKPKVHDNSPNIKSLEEMEDEYWNLVKEKDSYDVLDEISILYVEEEGDDAELDAIVPEEDNYLSKIKEAKELLDDGAITQEEYNILKRKLLDLI